MINKRFEKVITTSEYIDEYVNIAEFLEACKDCPNYSKIWSCPPYDFNPMSIWSRYEKFLIIAEKIDLSDLKKTENELPFEELEKRARKRMIDTKNKLSDELYEMEFEFEQKGMRSLSLSAGACGICGYSNDIGHMINVNCTRKVGKPCKFPNKMRYSIESLGGDVGRTLEKLMGIELEWITEGKLPNYYILVSGLLYDVDSD